MPQISVIVPVYRVEKYIGQCVESILNQTYRDFELILVDDGSPDNCPSICDDYANKDARVKVIHKQNGGVSAARNSGLEIATGKWIYLVDSDDWIELDALEYLIKEGENQNVDCVLTDGMECYTSGRQNRLYMFSQAFRTDDRSTITTIQKTILCHKFSPYYSFGADNEYPAPWTKFFKRDVAGELRFDPYVQGHFDDGLFSMYLLDRVSSLYYNRRHSYNYRIITESITRNFNPRTIELMKRNCERMDDFIRVTGKDDSFKQAEYCRRVSFFAAKLSSYYFNPNNQMSYTEKIKAVKNALTAYPFDEAFKKAKIGYFENKHKYILICGKLRFIPGLQLYARLKQRYKKI